MILQSFHMRRHCVLEFALIAYKWSAVNACLQVAIPILVWIQLQRIRGKVEDLDLQLVILEPRIDDHRVRNVQIVKNQ